MPGRKKLDYDALEGPASGTLPKAGAELLAETFKRVLYQYYEREGRPLEEAETIAAQAAWSQVKRHYYKDRSTGKWRKRKKPKPRALNPSSRTMTLKRPSDPRTIVDELERILPSEYRIVETHVHGDTASKIGSFIDIWLESKRDRYYVGIHLQGGKDLFAEVYGPQVLDGDVFDLTPSQYKGSNNDYQALAAWVDRVIRGRSQPQGKRTKRRRAHRVPNMSLGNMTEETREYLDEWYYPYMRDAGFGYCIPAEGEDEDESAIREHCIKEITDSVYRGRRRPGVQPISDDDAIEYLCDLARRIAEDQAKSYRESGDESHRQREGLMRAIEEQWCTDGRKRSRRRRYRVPNTTSTTEYVRQNLYSDRTLAGFLADVQEHALRVDGEVLAETEAVELIIAVADELAVAAQDAGDIEEARLAEWVRDSYQRELLDMGRHSLVPRRVLRLENDARGPKALEDRLAIIGFVPETSSVGRFVWYVRERHDVDRHAYEQIERIDDVLSPPLESVDDRVRVVFYRSYEDEEGVPLFEGPIGEYLDDDASAKRLGNPSRFREAPRMVRWESVPNLYGYGRGVRACTATGRTLQAWAIEPFGLAGRSGPHLFEVYDARGNLERREPRLIEWNEIAELAEELGASDELCSRR